MITRKDKVIVYKVGVPDTEPGSYYIERLEDVHQGDFPVCTMEHFVTTMMKLSEEVFPTIRENPLWQKNVNWNQIKTKDQDNAKTKKDTD